MDRANILKIEDLNSVILDKKNVKIKAGDEVLFHKEVKGDSQGRFITVTITFPDSKT